MMNGNQTIKGYEIFGWRKPGVQLSTTVKIISNIRKSSVYFWKSLKPGDTFQLVYNLNAESTGKWQMLRSCKMTKRNPQVKLLTLQKISLTLNLEFSNEIINV